MAFVPGFTSSNDRTIETSGPGGPAHRRPSQSGRDFALELQRTHTNKSTKDRAHQEAIQGSEKIVSSDSSSEDAESEVKQLARKYSHASTIGENPFDAPEDSAINPQSEKFRARAWIKAMLKLREDSDSAKDRTAGVVFKDLSVYGYSAPTDYQKTVGNYPLDLIGLAKRAVGQKSERIDILRNFEGLVKAGEMLVVLGPPGSGCSTFLKTLAGETHGFNLERGSYLNYQGISYDQMHKDFRGETIYTAEQDVHFPSMTVGETLLFAARARAPRLLPQGVTVKQYTEHLRDVIMAIYGIRHTFNTKVGNDFVRGVSGGERKRVTIAEASLSGAPLQCWDNSTRGLDSANAIEFCKTLRTSCELSGTTAAVAIYQAPQSAYEFFDKAIVLYEGHQIYFGSAKKAKQYFEDMGFVCPDRQTDADFLTSMTSPPERIVREGWEGRVPRTSDDFAQRWRGSETRKQLLLDIEEYEREHPVGGEDLKVFQASRKQQQSKHQRLASPYTLSYWSQIKLCLWRGFRRLAADPSLTITQLVANAINALIVSSLFYNISNTSTSLRARASLLFFAVLLNGFASALEILVLYAQRPIVEKHTRYAFYHPSAEAFASMLTDIPAKIGNAVAFNLVLYFMTNLRREPGAFFFFFLISFVTTLVMSMLFRTIASVSRSLVQALVPTAIIMIALIVYTGFVIPVQQMLGWSRWINYLNPVAYGFESLMVNEFSGQNYTCDQYIPPAPQFGDGSGTNQVCATLSGVPGQTYINGDAYIDVSYAYYAVHKWRNLGVLFAFMFGLLGCYLAATEFITAKKSKGEVLLFQRGNKPAFLKQKGGDIESGNGGTMALAKGKSHTSEKIANIQKQTAIFQWKDVCYDITIKKEQRRILDHVDGWVKPGTMTALMGVSGAGKTTLLDVLATRTTMGVIGGEMLVDGRQRDDSFQRKTGYVQQQDLHLETSTVREALNFSALLRQPAHVSKAEKLAYVDEVVKLLDMEEYVDAVVGVPGEGLNVEQRKRLTIGVELAAKPQLLLFLDEPTSGLDSQTSWSILDLLEKLMRNGQAILCTIHQPSAMLFQRFDRLLFLAKGGKTVYFGPVGENASVLSSYFERNGASPCPPHANPAEWMLEVIGAAPGTYTDIDWHQTWRDSPEIQEVHAELERLKIERLEETDDNAPKSKEDYLEFAASFPTQMWIVLKRIFAQYWRTPSYIYSKILLCATVGLFISFSFFKAQNSQQGIQNQLFGIFMLLTLFSQLVQQLMPNFVTQRALYEARERPSKTYSWKAFMLSNMIVDLPWSLLAGTILFFCWYYPIGLYNNAIPTNAVAERGALCFLLILAFLWFSSTFAHMVIAGIDTAETAGNVGNLMFSLSLIFCGVLVGPNAMPGIWHYTMYYISPFHYLVEGLLTDAVGGTSLVCATSEFLHFDPPNGATCAVYLKEYLDAAKTGYFLNPDATSDCQFCAISDTNTFLQQLSLDFNNAWRDFGIMFIYIIFNFFAALLIYWLARVPKKSKKAKKD